MLHFNEDWFYLIVKYCQIFWGAGGLQQSSPQTGRGPAGSWSLQRVVPFHKKRIGSVPPSLLPPLPDTAGPYFPTAAPHVFSITMRIIIVVKAMRGRYIKKKKLRADYELRLMGDGSGASGGEGRV